jgi:hypothetical protein
MAYSIIKAQILPSKLLKPTRGGKEGEKARKERSKAPRACFE